MASSQSLPALTPNALRLTEKMLALPRTWLTAATLAGAVGISRRTVLRELPYIEQWMSSAGFRFLRSPGQGLLLDEDEESRDRLRRLLEENRGPSAMSRQERRQQLQLVLMGAREPMKSYALARSLNISENTLSADLDAVEDALRAWDVNLRRRPGVGIWLEAPPERLRRATGALVKTQLFSRDLQTLLREDTQVDSPLAQLIEPGDARTIWKLLQEFDREEALHLPDSQLISLAVHLVLTVRQLRQGAANSVCPTPAVDCVQAARLGERLSQALNVTFTPAEIGNLALYLDAYGQSTGPDSREMELRYLVTYLIQGVAGAMHADLSHYPKLADDLCSHLRPMLLRLSNQVHTENPQLSVLQEQYRELWQATRSVCDSAHQAGLSPAIPDSEAGYLAMHIGAVLEQENLANMRLDAVIVCPYGVATSRFLAAQLARDFPSIRIVAHCPVQALDPQTLRQQGVGLIISTVPLQIDYPHVRINSILQEPDRALLRAAMDSAHRRASAPARMPQTDRRAALRYTAEMSAEILSLLNHVTLRSLRDSGGKETVFRAAAGLFCEDASQADHVEGLLWDREALGNTYIEPLQALLLHCRTDAVEHCRVGYLAVDPPLNLEEQWIRGALVLLAPAQGEIPLEVMQAVSALLIEDGELMTALRCCDRTRAVELLEAGLSQRFRQALTMKLK